MISGGEGGRPNETQIKTMFRPFAILFALRYIVDRTS
jgi:hypothetical protein